MDDYYTVYDINELNNLSKDHDKINLIGNFDGQIVSFPDHIKSIIFNHNFNQSIDNLPDSIEFINLGMEFRQPINKLPSNLRGIKFQCDDEDFFICDLPDSLEWLDISGMWNFHNQTNKLPPYITTILCTLDSYMHYSKDINYYMPNVKTLIINEYPCHQFNIPPKLEKLVIGGEDSKQSHTDKLLQYYHNYIVPYDTEMQDSFGNKIYQPSIVFNDRTIVFDGQIEDFICDFIFIDKNGTKTRKNAIETFYETCENFLLQGYNIKCCRSK